MCLIEFPQQHGGSDIAMNCTLFLGAVIISVNDLTVLEDMTLKPELIKSVLYLTDFQT